MSPEGSMTNGAGPGPQPGPGPKAQLTRQESIGETHAHAWFFEPNTSGVISPAGLENIANHKYKPGKYTKLDNLLNPLWTSLTNLLPMWLAPNMVTTLGGLHCGFAYALLWYFSSNFDVAVPSWVLLISGYCTLAYYTFDCMDGKQARRTGAASPLGQLFDHGFDCICNMAHCANAAGYLMCGGTYWYLLLQATLQFAFFMAQWEEYYTHILPHATGDYCGVTEVNYGLGVITIIFAFVDREALFTRSLSSILPSSMGSTPLPSFLSNLELRHVGILGWTVMVTVLASLSVARVWTHLDKNTVRLSAMSKLLSPLLLAITPFFLPASIIQHNTRSVSVATGLMFSLLTKKIIVYSMAKMTFATIQFDVIPFVLSCLWIRYDTNLTENGADLILAIFCLWHGHRMTVWAKTAIDQICERLDIYCLSIKKKKD